MRMTGFSGNKMSQRADELRKFLRIIRAKDVRSYLEIGARHGDTFFEVMTSLPAGSVGVAVDLPDGDWGTKGSHIALNKIIAELVRRGYDVRAVYGDSHSPSVRAKVKRFAPFDCVLIDADHRYEAVKMDWRDYSPMGRIVALHDIDGDGARSHKTRDYVGVPMLWRELKDDPLIVRRKAIVGKKRGMGIGVAWMSKEQRSSV